MFWKKGDTVEKPQSGLDGSAAPIDPSEEKQRIAKLTGDQPITIHRDGGSKIKLPGL
jgi:hypothetical protein